MIGRFAIIGDLHGRVDKLDLLLMEANVSDNRTLIFVGDYINRGPDSCAVLDRLIELSVMLGDRAIFLRGNHEQSLLNWLAGGLRDSFLRNGGLSTVRSYTDDRSEGVLNRFIRTFPDAHREFIDNTQLYYENDNILVSHAGFDPLNFDRRDAEAMVFGQRSTPLLAENATKLLPAGGIAVFGHYVQDDCRPLIEKPLYCIDTGCGTLPDGRLTALLLPEGRTLQF